MYLIDRKIFIEPNGRLYVVSYKAIYSIVQHLSSAGALAPAARLQVASRASAGLRSCTRVRLLPPATRLVESLLGGHCCPAS